MPNEAATIAFAKAIGHVLRPGDTLLLEGPVGAGKTAFARALIQSRLAELGKVEDVPSPTFTLVQTYEAGDTAIWHADLYRLSDPDEVPELGLTEAFETAIVLVEWPEKLGPYRPDRHLRLNFDLGAGETDRRLTVAQIGAGWDQVLAILAPSQ